MAFGAHLALFISDAGAGRFLAGMLNMEAVEVGGGWLMLALPLPTDVAKPLPTINVSKTYFHN